MTTARSSPSGLLKKIITPQEGTHDFFLIKPCLKSSLLRREDRKKNVQSLNFSIMEITKILGIFVEAKKEFKEKQLELMVALIDEKVNNSMNESLIENRTNFKILFWSIGTLTALVIAILALVVTKL